MIPNAKTAREASGRVERGKKRSPTHAAGSLEVVRSQRRKEGDRWQSTLAESQSYWGATHSVLETS